jgi:hypothetical protein
MDARESGFMQITAGYSAQRSRRHNTEVGNEDPVPDGLHGRRGCDSSLSGIKYQLESNLTGVTGTGTISGARYVMNDQTSDMQHADFDPLGNAQQTMEESTTLTRQGESGALLTGDDFRLHVLLHLTVSNGVPRADSYDLRADCR